MALFDNVKKILSDKVSSIEIVSSEMFEQATKGARTLTESISDFSTDTIETISNFSENTISSAECFLRENVDGLRVSTEKLNEWIATVPSTIHHYANNFDVEEFWKKISSSISQVGQDMLFMLLTYYYAVSEHLSKNEDERK